MKPHQLILAKETGHLSGGKGAQEGSVAAAPAAAAGPSDPFAECPFGVAVTVTSAKGEKVTAIRHPYQPVWFNEDRSGGIAFDPVSWEPLA